MTAEVKDGLVTLRGQVRHHYQRKQPSTPGTNRRGRAVGDLITLTDSRSPATSLPGSTRPSNVAPSSITGYQVSNVGHTIYLEGSTSSYRSMTTAEDTAWNAPGVSDVVDHLKIEPVEPGSPAVAG